MGLAPSIGVLILGRFVVGLGVGSASMVIPIYLAEVAHPHSRGTAVAMFQLAITVGILASYLVCLALGD
jgi:MFS family permease